MRILIAVPTFENITPDTFKSIYELKRGDFETEFTFVRGYDCAKARNKIAEEAIKRKVDYVFMVDSDIILPKTALIHLLEHYPEVCNGYYIRHKAIQDHDETTVNKIGKLSSNAFTAKELSDKRKNKIYRLPIRSAGAGCMLIKTSVFESISYPWFDYVSYKNKTFLSEDYYFCQLCRKAGIIMLVDTRVACKHRFTYFRNAESGN